MNKMRSENVNIFLINVFLFYFVFANK